MPVQLRHIAAAAVAAIAIAPTAFVASTAQAGESTVESSTTQDMARLRGSAHILWPPSPNDIVQFSVDAYARYNDPNGSPLPSESWGTAWLSHRFTGQNPGLLWYSISVDCLMTGGRTATVTGIVTDASDNAQSSIGTRFGFSVADLGRRHDRVGFSGGPRPGDPELRKCMAPAMFFTLKDGDYTVTDADHWQ